MRKVLNRNYAKDVEVGNDLEAEWTEHPSIYMYYADAYVEALYLRDKAKIKLDYIAAKIDLFVRKNPEKFDLPRVTDKAIKNIVIVNKKYRKVEELVLKRTKELNNLMEAKRTFEHKKAALGNLVSLKITGFYSEPKNLIQELKKKKHKINHKKHAKTLTVKGKKRKKQNP